MRKCNTLGILSKRVLRKLKQLVVDAAPEQRLHSMQVCASLDRAASECNDACIANSSVRRSSWTATWAIS